MAKAIPRKAVKKVRSKKIEKLVDPKEQKSERVLEKYIMELDERSEEREKFVKKILSVNDSSIENIIGWMVEELQAMQGPPKLVFKGRSYNAIKGEDQPLKKIQERNFRWIAVRCLIACAEWDIQIGNFKMPTDVCARCGVKLKGKKK